MEATVTTRVRPTWETLSPPPCAPAPLQEAACRWNEDAQSCQAASIRHRQAAEKLIVDACAGATTKTLGAARQTLQQAILESALLELGLADRREQIATAVDAFMTKIHHEASTAMEKRATEVRTSLAKLFEDEPDDRALGNALGNDRKYGELVRQFELHWSKPGVSGAESNRCNALRNWIAAEFAVSVP